MDSITDLTKRFLYGELLDIRIANVGFEIRKFNGHAIIIISLLSTTTIVEVEI